MPDERTEKELAARRMVLLGVIKALIKSHPDQNALRAAWAGVSAEIGAFDQFLSAEDDLGEDAEMTALLRRETDRWSAEIHRKR